MVQLHIGDRISCKIKDLLLVSPYSDYDEIKVLEIIALDDSNSGYFTYVPYYIRIKQSEKITDSLLKTLKLHKKYLNENLLFINNSMIHAIDSHMDGLTCKKCNEYYRLSEANQEDGNFICWTCRTYRTYG